MIEELYRQLDELAVKIDGKIPDFKLLSTEARRAIVGLIVFAFTLGPKLREIDKEEEIREDV